MQFKRPLRVLTAWQIQKIDDALHELGPYRQSTRLGRHALSIGRDRRCSPVLDDPRVSAQHARIVPTPSGYVLTDLGSSNGTRVNGRQPAHCHRGNQPVPLPGCRQPQRALRHGYHLDGRGAAWR